MPQSRVTVRMSYMKRIKDMTPEEKQAHQREVWRRNKKAQRKGDMPKHRRGQVSRKTATELLYGPEPTDDKSVLVPTSMRLPLALIEQIDNAEVFLEETLMLDKTQLYIDGMEAHIQRLQKLYNKGKPFPTPPPGRGLRRFADEKSEE